MQNSLKASAVALAMLFLICQNESAQAFEQERFQKGLDAYSAGELDVARMHLFTFIKYNKGYYPAHYHLANILLQLGEYAEARTQYQAVLALKPDKTTAGHCRTALARLAYMPAYGEPTARAKQNNPAVAQSIFEDMASRAQALDASRSEQMKTEKARILADADKQAEQVLDEAQKRISSLNSTGNWRVYYTNEKHEPTGEAGVGVPDRVANSIMEPAREEANRIREAARQRVARMSGGSGGNIADTVMGLSKQAQSDSGPRLSLDSNLHVRNYSHNNNMVAGKNSPTR